MPTALLLSDQLGGTVDEAKGHTMCECIKEMNAVLAKHNGRLAMSLQVTPEMNITGRYLMETEKLDEAKRKLVPKVMCRHCPFCGEKLAGD